MASALPFMEPLHILGSGSIGLFFASTIRSAFPSYPLAVLFRGQHRKSQRLIGSEKEIVVCTRQISDGTVSGKKRRQRPRMARVPFQFTDDHSKTYDGNVTKSYKKIRNLLLCTKAYQVEQAIQDIQNRLDSSNLCILLMCNGALDVRDKVRDKLQSFSSSVDLVMCTTTHGVIHETPLISSNETGDEKEGNDSDDMFHLLHIGVGKTYLGSGKRDNTQSIAQLFDQSGLAAQCIQTDKMEALLWQKLAANCICNPLTALWDVPNGRLNENPKFPSWREQILNEISRVAIALHPELENELNAESLDAFVEQVIQTNSQNRSSMYYDLRRGQRTEVESLNGFVIRKSLELGLPPAPSNEELVARMTEFRCYDLR